MSGGAWNYSQYQICSNLTEIADSIEHEFPATCSMIRRLKNFLESRLHDLDWHLSGDTTINSPLDFQIDVTEEFERISRLNQGDIAFLKKVNNASKRTSSRQRVRKSNISAKRRSSDQTSGKRKSPVSGSSRVSVGPRKRKLLIKVPSIRPAKSEQDAADYGCLPR